MILKAGTYRFNDVLEQLSYFDGVGYNIQFISNDVEYRSIEFFPSNQSFMAYNPKADSVDYDYIYSTDNVWVNDLYKTITFPIDIEVEDVFGEWYIANTNYNEVNALVSITYNGQVIAALNANEEATLSCKGKKMTSDVVIKIGEVQGGGIIEVDELPTENIDENAIYKIRAPYENGVIKAGTYSFNDVLTTLPLGDYYFNFTANGYSFTFLRVYGTDTLTDMSYLGNNEVEDVYSFNQGRWPDADYQTITITTDAEVNDTFGDWFNANVQVTNDGLYRYEKNEGVLGTWVINEGVDNYDNTNYSDTIFLDVYGYMYTVLENGTFGVTQFSKAQLSPAWSSIPFTLCTNNFEYPYSVNYYHEGVWGGTSVPSCGYEETFSHSIPYDYSEMSEEQKLNYRTIVILGGKDISDTTFVNWLKANATKQHGWVQYKPVEDIPNAEDNVF